MRRRVKFLVSSLMAVAGSLAMINFAQAAEITATNEMTGACSENDSTVVLGSEQNVAINNNADINNDIVINANTGGNSASFNTGDGVIDTGDANISVGIENKANEVFLSDEGNGSDFSVESSNFWTGARSENESEVSIENENEINIDNNADVDNDLRFDVNTGDNEAEDNLGDGEISTGDVDINADILNHINVTSVEMEDFGFGVGDISATNERTGFDSENETEVSIEDENEIDVDNDADIENNFHVDANTGDNEAEENIDDSTIDTGDVNIETDIENVANLTSVSLGDSADLNVEVGNDTTGACSENEVDVDIEAENEIDIDNDADVDNNLHIDANTGDNEAEENCGDGEIETGDIDVNFDIINKINETAVDFNCGMGNIDIEAFNEETGFGSENEIDIEVENEDSLNINNDADIDNDLCIEANTGDNEADENSDDSSISSGDVNIEGNLETIANISDVEMMDGVEYDISASNDTTGAESENEVKIEIENTLEECIENDSDIDNQIQVDIETGDNEAGENCGEGDVESGDVDINADIISKSNLINGDEDIDLEENDCFDFSKDLEGEGLVDIVINGSEVE